MLKSESLLFFSISGAGIKAHSTSRYSTWGAQRAPTDLCWAHTRLKAETTHSVILEKRDPHSCGSSIGRCTALWLYYGEKSAEHVALISHRGKFYIVYIRAIISVLYIVHWKVCMYVFKKKVQWVLNIAVDIYLN